MLEEHTWLAQSVECVTLDLRVMGSNPMWEVEILKNKILKKKKKAGGENKVKDRGSKVIAREGLQGSGSK